MKRLQMLFLRNVLSLCRAYRAGAILQLNISSHAVFLTALK